MDDVAEGEEAGGNEKQAGNCQFALVLVIIKWRHSGTTDKIMTPKSTVAVLTEHLEGDPYANASQPVSLAFLLSDKFSPSLFPWAT
jgi:hypothetical protein